MEYTKEELLEAKQQIDSTVHKLRTVVKTLDAKEDPADTSRRAPWPSAGWRLLRLPMN